MPGDFKLETIHGNEGEYMEMKQIDGTVGNPSGKQDTKTH